MYILLWWNEADQRPFLNMFEKCASALQKKMDGIEINNIAFKQSLRLWLQSDFAVCSQFSKEIGEGWQSGRKKMRKVCTVFPSLILFAAQWSSRMFLYCFVKETLLCYFLGADVLIACTCDCPQRWGCKQTTTSLLLECKWFTLLWEEERQTRST